ncbi:MAG: bifunctional oligoribonuclease/PAP phosphatase NrnA [Patescibacteria group bacterium]|nr:bifunctional oligoribonuclease/PAP phosphatase NrnA [Patescibacteria group bacterium]
MFLTTAGQIDEHLKQAKKIIIVPHPNPDGDALGCASAMAEYLKSLGKDYTIFCATEPPRNLNFLKHCELVRTDEKCFSDPQIDTALLVDCGDLRYAGIANFLTGKQFCVINIDHHATNEHYGHFNLVIPEASSASEVVYNFFKIAGARVNHDMATALLTGILTDTDNFSNPATSASALNAGGELLRRGANLRLINRQTLKNKNLNTLKIWGRALARLVKDEKRNIAYTYITRADAEEYNVSDNDVGSIANFLNNLEETEVFLLLKEDSEGNVKGSFRTTSDEIDVSLLAKKMGGGGHKKAAGFRTQGTIEETLKQILTDE